MMPRNFCQPGCECGRHKSGPSKRTGTDNVAWKGDDAGYGSLHKRVRNARGKASEHDCVKCAENGMQKKADDWAQVHGEPGTDPWADYVPLCHSCHMLYDGIGGFTPESREKIAAAQRGREKSPESRAKMRESHKGVPLSEKHRASLSAAQRARREREQNERDS